MRIKPIFIAIFVFAISTDIVAQRGSVVVTPNKVVYRRNGKNVPEFKKTFEVTYPIISGTNNAQTKTNIKATLNYWKNFDTTLKENMGEYHWLTSFAYKVNYNKNWVFQPEPVFFYRP